MATTTVNTSPIGIFAPYQLSAAQSLQNTALQPYQPYQGQRVAGITPLEGEAFDTAANFQTPTQFGDASRYTTQGIESLLNRGGTAPGTFSGLFTPRADGSVDASAAQRYFNPYTQSVVDIAKREAQTDFAKQQSQRRARAASAGAFGGSRATLLETEAERAQNQLLSDIQTKGLESAYGNARSLFGEEADRADRANATALQGAQGLASIGSRMSEDERSQVAQQAALGLQQRSQKQAAADAAYGDYLEARDYGLDRAKTFASGIAGLSSGYGTKTETTPDPSTLNTVLGAILTGTSALGALGGSGGASAGWDFLVDDFAPDVVDFFKGLF